MSRTGRNCLNGLALVGALSLTGCQVIQPAAFLAAGSERMTGTVLAAQQPIAGASIQLYAAGTGGDGSTATPLNKAPVTSNDIGSFDLTGMYECPSASAEVYLVATVAPQIALMKALGPCGSLTAATRLDLNEVTTVAATYALAPYMKSYSAVGSTSGDAPRMASLFAGTAELASIGTAGISGIGSVTGQAVPAERLSTLANILADCANSSGRKSLATSACGYLFSLASAASNDAPTDTVGALLDIARNPASTVAPWNAPAGSASVTAPAFSTPTGTYGAAQTVAILTTTPGANLYYTTNGSTPTAASLLYTSPIKVSSTETLQAVAVLPDASVSPVASATYTIGLAQAAALPAAQPTATAKPKASVHTDAQTGTQTITLAMSNNVQTAGIDRPGINLGGLGGYGSQQIFKSLNYVNGGYFPGTYAGSTWPCRGGGPNTTTTWHNDVTNPGGYPANFWAGATFDAINASTGTSYGSGTISASTTNTGSSGITFTLSPAISSACNPDQNDVMIVRLTKQNTQISPYQLLNQHICGNATWDTNDTSPSSGNTQQSLEMPSGCGLTFYIDATVTNRTNTNSNLAQQQNPYLNLNGPYNATFKAKCLVSGCSINFSLGRLGGTTFVGNTTVAPVSNASPGAGWTTYNYPFTASEDGTQPQTIGYSFTCTGTCLLQDADVIEGSTLAGNTTVFRDAVVYELQKLHPGSIRYMDGSQWCSDVADEIASTGNRRWCGTSNYGPGVGQAIGYNDVLTLANFIGSDVMISIGQLNQPSDWTTLINWLNSSGWISTYAAAGHKIYLEDGNEAWNSGVGATLYFGNGQAYGYTLGPNMAAAKAAAGYNSSVIKLVGNSWVAGSQGYGPFGWVHNTLNTAQVTTNGLPDFVGVAPYTLNYLGNFDTSGSNVATTGAPFLDEWAEDANLDSVTSPPLYTESMYLNQQYVKSNYGVSTLVYEINYSTVAGVPATQLQLDQIGASVGQALATTQHALLMQRDSQVTGPIHVFTLAEPYTGYSCNGCGIIVMPLWGVNHLMGTGPGQAPGTVTADRPLAIALQVINNAIGSNNNLMSATQTGTPTFSYPGGQVQGSSNSISPNSAVPYVNCFTYSNNGSSAWTVICFNNNLTTPESVSLTGTGAPTGSVSETVFPGPSNIITDHNENTYLGASSSAPVVTLPSAITTSGATYSIPPASMIALTYNTAGGPPTLATPTFSPGTGNYTGSQTVNIAFPSGSTGCVGINTTPTAPTPGTCGPGGSTYAGPITVNASETVNAIATQAGSLNSAAGTAAYTIAVPTAAIPTFSPAAGTYTSSQSVTISDATAGTTIYYTTNGTMPTTSSSVYGSAITVSATETIEAIAVETGYTTSAAASAAYTIAPLLPAPSFSPGGGTYTTSQSVTITDATAGTTIYYTTNGTTPTTSSSVYGAAITVSASQTLQAIAVKTGFTNSPAASAAYTINPILPAPSFSPGGGTYTSAQSVSITDATAGTTIYYTTNGTTPTTSSSVYGSPLNVASTQTIQAIAVKNGFTNSPVGSAAYTVSLVAPPAVSTACYQGSGAPSLTLGPLNTTGANTIAIAVASFNAISSVTDNQGNGNATALTAANGGSPNNQIFYWQAPNVGSGHTITINGGSGLYGSACVFVMSGVSGVYSGSQNASSAGYGSSSCQAGSITPSSGPQVVIAGFGVYTPSGAPTIDSSYTLGGYQPGAGGSAFGEAAAYIIQPAGAATNPRWNWNNSASSPSCVIAAFGGGTGLPTAATPTFMPAGGTYTSSQSVTISDATPGTTIYYTTNGTTPTTASSVYGGAIIVSSSQTLQAIAVESGYTNSTSATAGYTINTALPAPSFSPGGGTYTSTQSVSITDTAGTTIYYTTNGTTPTTGSSVYGSPISVAASQTIQAIAIETGYTNSPVALASYTVNPVLPAPSFSPGGGSYATTQSVSITDATAGTTIYYTTNGTTPTTGSSVYGSPINVATSQTIQAIAVKGGFTNSPVGSAAYTINPILPAPSFSPGGGTYTSAQSVSITDTTAGTTIYYTTNGTTPTTSSNVYGGPMNVATSQTLQAIAVENGFTTSSPASATYTISSGSGSGPGVSTACYQGSGAPSLTLGPLNTTGANTIAIAVASFNAISSVTDNEGNGNATALTAANGGSPNNQIFYWQAPNVGSGHTITINGGSGLYGSACVFVMSGVSGVYSGSQNATAAGYGSSSCQAGSITPSSGAQVVIAGFGVYTPSGVPTIDSSYTLGAYQPGAGGSAFGEAAAYIIQPAGAATNPRWNWNNGASSPSCVIAAFGGGTGSPTGPAPTAATPTFTPVGGTYTSAQSVTINETTPGTTIYYTTNGTIPTTASSVYGGAIIVSASQTLQAIAVESGYTNSAAATAAYTINTGSPGSATTYINVASGQFTASSFYLNSSPTITSGGVLELTDGRYGEGGSAWFNSQVPVSNFVNDFTFQIPYANGDGMTFTIQSQGSSAIGAFGAGLGYQGINNSVAIKFDLYDNAGEGPNSTGLYINGAAPMTPAVDLGKTGINLHGGNILHAHMVYDGTNLTMTLTDTVTGASTVQVFPVNIPAAVGSSTAYVGFTGGTGGVSSTQNILTWSYTATP